MDRLKAMIEQSESDIDEDAQNLLEVDSDMRYLQEIQGKKLFDWVTQILGLLFSKYNEQHMDIEVHINFNDIDYDSDYEGLQEEKEIPRRR